MVYSKIHVATQKGSRSSPIDRGKNHATSVFTTNLAARNLTVVTSWMNHLNDHRRLDFLMHRVVPYLR